METDIQEPIRFTRLSHFSNLFYVLGIIYIASSLFMIWVILEPLLNGHYVEETDNYTIYFRSIYIMLGALYISAIFYGCVTHNAMANLNKINAPNTEVPPWLTWFWHFVPIFSLWKPRKAMREIWHASSSLDGQQAASQSKIQYWWATWLLGTFSAYVSSTLYGSAQWDSPTMIFSVYLEIFSYSCDVISAFLIIHIIKEIATWQDEYAEANGY